ncbi:hypothetical protein KY342_02595 [Candidatus Woesearchaeota archaeon]|nr:hypothetical protein [Candidatus Woesearchaeota archaeon]
MEPRRITDQQTLTNKLLSINRSNISAVIKDIRNDEYLKEVYITPDEHDAPEYKLYLKIEEQEELAIASMTQQEKRYIAYFVADPKRDCLDEPKENAILNQVIRKLYSIFLKYPTKK